MKSYKTETVKKQLLNNSFQITAKANMLFELVREGMVTGEAARIPAYARGHKLSQRSVDLMEKTLAQVNISPDKRQRLIETATARCEAAQAELTASGQQGAASASNSAETTELLTKVMSELSKLQGQQAKPTDETRIIELIKQYGAKPTEIKLVVDNKTKTIPTGMHHKILPEIIKMLSAGVNVMMVGPAGSGKTTIAEQAAKTLERSFYFNGALSSEYKLSGFVDANGRIVSTAFRRAYEDGGVYLFDEIDASMPDALLAFNAALANGHADFPDGAITKHKDFSCIAAANTYGRGADRIYVGRNQLDGASLDRFCVVNVDYDETLERQLAGNDEWTAFVQKIRQAVCDLKIRHVVSPRASISGAKLLAAGLERSFVEEATIWKGLDKDSVYKINIKANAA